MTPTFNLLDEPWIKVIRLDGSVDELSLLRLFREAEDISQIRGEIASQDIAILRLLLAICHRTMQGPEDLSTWKRYWKDPQLLTVDTASYLERYRDRFDLRHPVHPFFQVAGLKAAPGSTDSYSLGEMVGDLPKPEKRLFTQRIFPEKAILPWGEAARWLIHLHGFDGPGTHSSALGDPNKNSRYAKAGFLGQIGPVYVKGKNLLETMLFNTVPAKELDGGDVAADRPPWEREHDDHRGKISRPLTGPATCYTWQTRRVLITGDNSGATRLFFSNGDAAELANGFKSEPMTAWKLSGKSFTPERPSQGVAAWRRLPSFLPQRVTEEKKTRLPPQVVSFYGTLMYRRIVPRSSLITVHTTSVIYENDHIKELVDDELLLPSAILSEESGQLLSLVADAMEETHRVAQAVGRLGFHLDLANGGSGGRDGTAQQAELHAQTAFYHIIDEKFPRWLVTLNSTDPKQAHTEWCTYLLHEGRAQGIALTSSLPSAAFAGRRKKIEQNRGEENIDVGKALAWFHAALNKAIPQTETTHTEE